MFNAGEHEERAYLSEVREKLGRSLFKIEKKILDYSDSMIETKRYAWESGNLDPVERAAYKIAMNEESIFAEHAIKERNQLRKLMLSPYFGRVDFLEAGAKDIAALYIGIHSYSDEALNREIIIDWRAPVSSIFYDYETGPAMYKAPEGIISGDISHKRQFRIRGGKMEYMLDSNINIGDDILQQELSRATDEKMKNIVATIQKEQNLIIRNESAKVLIIQGAAGSGKTSIALHRVAFLMYRHKNMLKSGDVLVISPSKVFGSYISNVLPELGEENIPQLGFDDLAKQFIGRTHKIQTFAEQVAGIISDPDEAKIERIRHKADIEFVKQLADYLSECDDNCFIAEDIRIGLFYITAKELMEEYKRLKWLPVKRRLEKIAADRIAAYKRGHEQPLPPQAARQIKERILKMFAYKDSFALYKSFFHTPGHEGMLHMPQKEKIEFCDAFPLAWLKAKFEGVTHRYAEIKHLLVDEMQDYTPMQYAFLSTIFSCRMTILGDSHQSVNPYSSSSMEKISPYFKGSECVELLKSYRSTVEIVGLAQSICKNKKIIPIERHGEEPTLTGCKNDVEQTRLISRKIDAFKESGYNSLGIICKSQERANALYKILSAEHDSITLLDFGSEIFFDGVVITSCHMSKGLEFDHVVVPDCSDEVYRNEMDRSLLYIACTRAMHVLELAYYGRQSAIIAPATILVQQVGSDFRK